MTLAMPRTQAVLDRMMDEIKNDPSYEDSGTWIGLREREDGEFEWIDGESVLDRSVWDPWADGRPHEYSGECGLLYAGQFFDTSCSYGRLHYTCEKGK